MVLFVEGRDFTVEYQKYTTLGNARAGISGIGNYYGYFTTSFSITYGRISNCDITVSNESLVFDGTEKKPAVTVTCNGNTLTQGQDYTLYYHANTNAGSATVTITGKGRFSGSVEKAFQIQPADLSRSSVDLSADSFTYDGTEKKPSVTVKTGNRQLTANSDYTVSFVNNTNAGSATVNRHRKRYSIPVLLRKISLSVPPAWRKPNLLFPLPHLLTMEPKRNRTSQ